MAVFDDSRPQAELQVWADEAHEQICLFGRVMRRNVDMDLAVEGA